MSYFKFSVFLSVIRELTFSLECPTSQNAINMNNYKSLMSVVRGILAVAAERHPVGARVE